MKQIWAQAASAEKERFVVRLTSAAPWVLSLWCSQYHRVQALRVLTLSLTLAILCVSPNAIASELRFERWRWSNPLPHGNNVMDMTVTSTIAVQVGDSGSVFVQGEDERWAPAVTSVTNYLRGFTFLGSRFVAVGEDGCFLWSDDGITFQKAQASGASAYWFEGVAASAQRAVAVGDAGAIYTSTNATVWSKATSSTTEWLRGVAFGNNVFVAVGESGKILKSSSSSGTSWSSVTSSTSAHLNRVRYLGTGSTAGFYAVGTRGTALFSSSGAAPWTLLNTGSTNTLFDVAINNNGLLLVGDQEILFRPDGSTAFTSQITGLPTNAAPAWTYYTAHGTADYWLVAGRAGMLLNGSKTNGASTHSWLPIPDSSHAWFWDLTVQNGICVAVGDLASIQTSLDGILWAREVVPGPNTNVVLLGVGGTTNSLVAVGNAGKVLCSYAGLTNMVVTNYIGTNIIVTNTTFETMGMIWTNPPVFTTNTLQGVAADANLYVVCGDRGTICTSPDTTNWTARPTPTTNFLSSVAASPAGWVVTGARGTMLKAGPDASNWSVVSLGTTNWIYRVRNTGGQLVAVGQNGVIFTSPDGNSWTSRTSGTKAWLNDVVWLDNKWFAVGTQGAIIGSSNLLNWIAYPAPAIKSLYAALGYEGKLIAAGVEGVILRNQLQPITTSVNFLGYDLSASVTTYGMNSTTNVYELFLFGGLPDQFFQLHSATNLSQLGWTTNATLELFDASGTIYLLRTRDLTNAPSRQFYRTVGIP